jgi:hypothetical protein
VGVFNPAEIVHLPPPAQRFLTYALTPGVQLFPTVLLAMEGEIKLRDWTPFRARQVLRAGDGFVWEATAGKPPLVFRGADIYWNGMGSLDFRLWGIIPVARAAGPDIDRSSAGRLAAETVAWAPQALTPQMGATWAPLDADRATVTLPVRDGMFDVTITVDEEGRLRELVMQRWGDAGSGPFGLYPFGSAFDQHAHFDGVTIASAGRVGWWWGTERRSEGEFFRGRITTAGRTGMCGPPALHRRRYPT